MVKIFEVLSCLQGIVIAVVIAIAILTAREDGEKVFTLAIESISSKKRIHGAAARALSKSSRTLASDSPNHIDNSSGPASNSGDSEHRALDQSTHLLC